MGETVPEIELDLRGLKCPLPALRTRKALAAAAPGTLLLVLCTDPLAGIDIPHLARETGDVFEGSETAEGYVTLRVRRSVSAAALPPAPDRPARSR